MPEALTVIAERTYPAPADRVFRALTEPALITRWWSPDPAIAVDVLAWDLTVGGRWRFAYRFPDTRTSVVTGAFTDIVPARQLGFTWTWEAPDPHAGIETLVTITLTETHGATAVRVIHEQFPDEATRLRHDEGWQATLARLAEIL